ncbi:MAG: undecaprenyl-diphosphatase UppP [Candidatus Levyibacteriota bacterium]
MDFVDVLIFSAVEGVSEFLPISSTGHLILTSEILKIPQSNFIKNFEIIIQLGAILAVVILYWKSFLLKKSNIVKIATAFIPTAIVGFLFFGVIKNYLLGNTNVTLLALLLGGIILIALEIMYKEKEHHVKDLSEISLRKAFLIGTAQSLSVIPGVSRSAATIIGGLFLGVRRKTAVEFSFLLAVPTMLAATSLDILKSDFGSYSSNEYLMLIAGFLGSFVFALVSIKFLLKFIQNHTFIPFGIYRIVISVLFWFIIIY